MTNTEVTETILAGPKGRAIDPSQVIAQLGRTVQMRIGYMPGTAWIAEDYVKFQVRCAPKRNFWVIIKLQANDTYAIEFGRLKNKFDWYVAAQAFDIYGDVLGEVVERMYVEVYS